MEPSFCFSCSSTTLLAHVQLVGLFLLMCCPVSTQHLHTPHLSLWKNVLFHFVSMMYFLHGKISLGSNLALLPSLVSSAHLVQYLILSLGQTWKYCIVSLRLNPCETLLTASIWLHRWCGFLEALAHPRIFSLSWPCFSSFFVSVVFKIYDTYCFCFAHKIYDYGKLHWLDRQLRAEKGN